MYIQNRSPHKVQVGMDVEETFSERKPQVGHMRMFGSPIYIHVPKYKRNNLNPLGKKIIYFCCNISSKAYKIYILENRWMLGKILGAGESIF